MQSTETRHYKTFDSCSETQTVLAPSTIRRISLSPIDSAKSRTLSGPRLDSDLDHSACHKKSIHPKIHCTDDDQAWEQSIHHPRRGEKELSHGIYVLSPPPFIEQPILSPHPWEHLSTSLYQHNWTSHVGHWNRDQPTTLTQKHQNDPDKTLTLHDRNWQRPLTSLVLGWFRSTGLWRWQSHATVSQNDFCKEPNGDKKGDCS